ncbi:NepR family anti-sigma factor [Alsobacter ponti]|uniref:NepR family anti-sigma factor n=1 Tax=Alsobacter ponti TaxID=2962936 RepID=UPI002113445B|nr:NepR family anti-sigma factor [Alsobacter ponti]
MSDKNSRRDRTGTGMPQIDIVASKSPSRQPEPSAKPDFQVDIGQQLRAVYDSVLNQPVPDRFLELLNELDKKTGTAKDEE